MLRSALFITLLAVPAHSFAQSTEVAEDETATVERSAHQLALSASVLRAVAAPMAEVGAELKHTDKIASAVQFGVGPGRVDQRNMAGDWSADTVLCLQAAAQFRYYALGNFDRGMFVGGEAVWIYLDRDRDNSVRAKHEGVWAGPSVGYKYTFDFGMVLSAMLTAALPIHKPSGLSEDEIPGEPVDDNHPIIGPALLGPNLSIGWAL